VGREIRSITALFLLVALFREFRDGKEADLNLSHAQTVRLPYKEWAENHIARIKGVLDGARAEHTQTVKDRIDEVGQMKDVVDLTKGLKGQNSALSPHDSSIMYCGPFRYRRLHSSRLMRLCGASKSRSLPRSRLCLTAGCDFEQQEKENEQARLVKTIVDNVLKSVSEEKTQKDVLAWAVSEVDREYPLFNFTIVSFGCC